MNRAIIYFLNTNGRIKAQICSKCGLRWSYAKIDNDKKKGCLTTRRDIGQDTTCICNMCNGYVPCILDWSTDMLVLYS